MGDLVFAVAAAPDGAGRQAFQVRISEAAEDGRLSLHAVVGWLQEAATANAAVLGVGLDWTSGHGLAWVLARLSVRMRRYPAIGARVDIATWPSGLESRRAHRDFVLREGDGRDGVIGLATSAWTLIDVDRKRPMMIAEATGGKITILTPRALEFESTNVPAPEETEQRRAVLPRPSDLDLLGHVNNARLAAWVMDAAYGVVPHPLQPAALDLAFRAECRLGDAVEALLGPDEEGRRRAVLKRFDGTELVRAAIRCADARIA